MGIGDTGGINLEDLKQNGVSLKETVLYEVHTADKSIWRKRKMVSWRGV